MTGGGVTPTVPPKRDLVVLEVKDFEDRPRQWPERRAPGASRRVETRLRSEWSVTVVLQNT